MAIYINMDRKLLRKGGRTAYSMAEGDLMGLLENALQRFRYNGSTDADMLLYNALSEFRGEAPFQKVCKDIEKIEVDSENVCYEGFVTGSNGVPALKLAIGGDWETPVRVFIYWDGKAFRAYIPVYGNCYNRFCNAALGSDGIDHGEQQTHTIQATKSGHPIFLDDRSRTVPVDTTFDVVLNEDNYNKFNWRAVDICDDACLEDFSCRVTSKGDIPRDLYNKALDAMDKLGRKHAAPEICEEEDLEWEPINFDCVYESNGEEGDEDDDYPGEAACSQEEEKPPEEKKLLADVRILKENVEWIRDAAEAYFEVLNGMADYLTAKYSEKGEPSPRFNSWRWAKLKSIAEEDKKHLFAEMEKREAFFSKVAAAEEAKAKAEGNLSDSMDEALLEILFLEKQEETDQ